MGGAAPSAMAGRDRSARDPGLLVLVASDGAPECGGGLSDLLEYRSGKSVDDAMAGHSFAGSTLRPTGDDQSGCADFFLRCGSGGAAADADRRQEFFGNGDRASSLAAVLATAARRSALFAARVSGLSDDGRMGGKDGGNAFCIAVRGVVCVQPHLDAGISELVLGAIVREFVVWRGHSCPRKPAEALWSTEASSPFPCGCAQGQYGRVGDLRSPGKRGAAVPTQA